MTLENETTNQKIRDNSVYQTEEFKSKISKITKDRNSSLSASRKQEIKEKISQKTKEGILRKYGSREKFKEETSRVVKELWKDPEYRKKTSEAIKKHYSEKPDVVRYSLVKSKNIFESIYTSKSDKKNGKYSLLFSDVFF